MKRSKLLIILGVLLVAVGAGGFFAGMKYQQSKQTSFVRQFGSGMQRTGQAGNRQGFRPVNGEIISADEKSITVKLQDGSSKIVLVNDKTAINKAFQGIKDDLKVGERVAVFGQENSDGTVTAQNIQLNPEFRGVLTPAQGQ